MPRPSSLAASLLLAFSACTAAAPVPPAANTQLAREVLSQLVSTASVHAKGSTEAAQLMAKRFLDAGFAPEDVQVLTPAQAPTKGNVVIRLHGKSKDKPLLYLGHLDVVEAKREDWNFDPFTLTEKDGWLYGRGTIDMLGQDAAMIASLIRLKQEGYVPERDIIVALTADEEAGGDYVGAHWLMQEHRAAVDAGLVINPDAGEAAQKHGRSLYVAVETSEKIYMAFQVEVTDKGGHSSRPTKANPIYRLARGLNRLSDYTFPLHLNETTRLYFAGRAKLATGQASADMLAVSRPNPPKAVLERLSADVETNIILRTTCVATEIQGGHAENALPQRARATIQCRVIPGESQDQTMQRLTKVLADPSLQIKPVRESIPSPESPPAQAILAGVQHVVGVMWPGVAVIPNMAPGASDSIYTRNGGMPTYGVDAMFDDLDDGRAHGRDERISVKVFEEEIEFTYRMMKEFSSQH
jgi:acetylornithine deacetylase/succinyl-diaminopimelate desuccinylase-like protein